MITTKPLNDAEIKQSIKLLKECINKKMFSFDAEHADPIIENCYISSSDIEGVYFPNSIITSPRHSNMYNVITISKVDNQIGVIYALKDDIEPKYKELFKPYIFEDFNNLLHDSDYLELKAKYEKNINYYDAEIKLLQSIKYKTKKDGSNFQRFDQNIEGVSIATSESNYKVGYGATCGYVYLYRPLDNRQADPSIAEFKQLVSEYITSRQEYINAYKEDLKTLENKVLKIKKAVAEINKLYKSDGATAIQSIKEMIIKLL